MTERDLNAPALIAGPARLDADLARMAGIAAELGVESLELDAAEQRRRLADARFFVACIGQFKRGKSTLLNALVGQPVLPVGVVPVTSVITVLRAGTRSEAVARFTSGVVQPIALDDLADVVDERRNPENRKGVTVVEVFLPSAILANGLCLVDTPGIGSVFALNTETTRAFLPHIDVALIVVGPDPPISGAELEVIETVSQDVGHLLLVLNKSDQASPEQRREVSAFTTDIVERRLGRRIETIFEVSARDRLEENRVTRDWPALEHTLTDLARQQRSALVVSAALRARQRIARRLRAEIDEQEAALRRPIEETAARAARLRAAVEGAERSLQDLRFLFDAAEAEVVRGLDRQRADFAQRAMPELRQSLEAWITANSRLRAAGRLRAGAFDEARRLAEQAISRWLAGVEPHVIALHETATRRFVQLANEFVARVMSDAEPIPVEPLDAVDVREYDRPHFYFASLMHLTAGTPATWLMDRFGFRTARERSVSRQVAPYLTHIVDTNSHRVENDFRERARLSRQQLERRIRERLRDALRSAERGLSIANAKQTMAEQEVRGRLEQLAGVRNEVCALDNDDRASAGEVG
ncbi:MAG: hypothetical protein A3H96_13180 [Acidobacteria bacterium RIFCSPLOWO2_02_FULL_67_36]|nr:MAG: hypothetical protein A3H96_13180 [Acidobacteria bacterium RIFCSPLOWO2_02_FULL_67_36]OFW23570.1 MAG: hypothetical protein A3G21_06485 [Acidobacteria bacterium RIFCSPLOWO2_12_FULL_66_21]